MASRISESERLYILTENERHIWEAGGVAAGLDEVGRGPLAGPVVACCVIMPSKPIIEGVNDSKKLSEKKRELLYTHITKAAVAYGLGWVSERVIDEINILNATKLAFEEAYANMKASCDVALIDAVTGLKLPCEQRSIIHGDALSYSIAAASIIAKVERDRYMIEMSKRYPEYMFAKNKGYGTREHIEALRIYGACEIHRKTFIKGLM